LQELNDKLTPMYQLFPPFNLASGLGNLAALDLKTELKGDGNANPYKWDVLGQSLVLMIGQAVAFLLLTLLIENGALLSLYHLLMLYASSPMTIFTQQSGTGLVLLSVSIFLFKKLPSNLVSS
jgi:hypothetical protein